MKIYSNKQSLLLDIEVDDNSYRTRAIQGDHNVTLYFSTAEHVEIPVGSYIEFQGETYTLERPEALKMYHTRKYEYTITFESPQVKAKVWMFRNPVDGRLKFNLTAKPVEHLQMFIDNMNRRDTGWTMGECIDGVETLISYDHAYCLDALTQMTTEFNTEYEIKGKQVSLRKVEYNKTSPLSLSYGKGNGFKSGISRSNYGDLPPVEILYAQGGSDNIDQSKYGSSELLLPKNQAIGYDGEHFEDEDGYVEAQARHYIVDGSGLSIRRTDKELSSLVESSLDCEDYYPKRVGTVSFVSCEDEAKHFWDIADKDIPENLNYEDYLLEGETMNITFQTGMLAGKTFDVTYVHKAVTTKQGVTKQARRFEIVPTEVDGITMPDKTTGYYPKEGDTYAVFNCYLPDAYICDNDSKTGASWDMFRACVKYLYDNEDTRFSFTGEIDGIWAKKNWDNIGGRIVLGGYVRFTDEHWQKEPVLVRITTIKDYINNPHSPEIELSNSTVTSGVSSTLKQLQSEEVLVDDLHTQAIQYTKRRFRDAKETMEMLEASLLENFTTGITPVSVQTMQMLVGDESLQFVFTKSLTDDTQVADTIQYDQTAKQLSTTGISYIEHKTLGITDMSSSHNSSEYLKWALPEFTSGRLEDGDVKYYLYAKVQRTTQEGEFQLSTTAHKIDEDDTCYWLLVGILNSEAEEERSFAPLFGFTEILPSRVTTDRVVSGDGESYFDMLNNAMKLGDALQFNVSGDGLLKLKGTLVQSQSGVESTLGCYRGEYNSSYTYYNGDEVIFTVNECTSLYRQINDSPCKGIDPTSATYWQVVAQGTEGKQGADGISPNTSFKSVAFYRSNTTPALPYGGSYASPVPLAWSDGIPAGEEKLWMSTRIFSSDGKSPQQSNWTTPRQITETADFDVVYSAETAPTAPTGHPNTNTQWTDESSDETIWMATAQKTNGIWADWQVAKIKGENGQDGTSVTIKGQAFDHYATTDDWTPDTSKTLVLIDKEDETTEETTTTYYNVVKKYGRPKAGWAPGWMTIHASEGDGYLMVANGSSDDGCLYVAQSEGWVNVGKIKGAKGDAGATGKSAYMHIKYANSLTVDDWSDNDGETPSDYIGVYTDDNPTDQLVWSLYSWKKWTGEDGFGYEYIYKLSTTNTAPATPTETSQEDGFVPTGWTDDPTGVDASNLYEWLCYRKKTDGVWGSFIGSASDNTKAALWAKYGEKGATGSKGDSGDYYELRYAVNGSTTTPPTLSKTSLQPSGWSTTVPTVGTAQYLWLTEARKTADGKTLVTQWSTPVRITPYDGKDGSDGKSPALVYRGVYSSSATYYGNDNRLDCVKYGDTYYISRIDAGTFSGIVPTSTDKWNSFGASFESVATQLLLAEEANIAGWVFRNNRLESQNGSAYLDGVNGEMRLLGTLQLSTQYGTVKSESDLADTNLFYLKGTSTYTIVNLPNGKEHIGKVVRIFNAGTYSQKAYGIGCYTTTWDGNWSTSVKKYNAIVQPQETIEITCFATADNQATWELTSRFSQQNFTSFVQDRFMGRFPLMLAMGYCIYSNKAFSFNGTMWNQKSIDSVFSIYYVNTGTYRLKFSTADIPQGSFFVVGGYGTKVIDARLGNYYWNGTDSYVEVCLSDDSSLNDGSFYFMVFAPNWDYPLQ